MANKEPRPATAERFGILNPYGDVWSVDTYDTPEDARKHLDDFWSNVGNGQHDTSKFKVIPVSVTVSVRARRRRTSPPLAKEGWRCRKPQGSPCDG